MAVFAQCARPWGRRRHPRAERTIFNDFRVLACGVPVYNLKMPPAVVGYYVKADLTASDLPPGGMGDLEAYLNDFQAQTDGISGTYTSVFDIDRGEPDRGIKNDIALELYQATPTKNGIWNIGYNWPFCVIDPSKFSDANPARPTITLDPVGPTFTGGSISTTPEIPPGRTCAATVSAAFVTTCQRQIEVQVGGCRYANKEFEVEVRGGVDPRWLAGNVQADPRISWVTTDGSGFVSIPLAIGDNTPSGATLEIIARAKPDASGNYAWTCPRNAQDNFVVDNRCTNFRAYYRTALGIVEMQDAGRYCASVLKELFFEIQHCKNDLVPLPNMLRVEVYDNLGQLYDREDITLEPVGTTLPVTRFLGSILTQANPMNHGNHYDKRLDYPKGKAGEIWIRPWADAADPNDTCPADIWKMQLIPPVPICFPNAITSGGGASWNGNFKVHWGDVVMRGNMTKPSQLIEKMETGQFDGSSFLGKSSITDRFVDVYIGRSDTGIANDGLITGFPLPPLWSGYIYQPFLPPYSPAGGNYFTNISREKISKMVVSLNYEIMKNLALNHSKNAYWVAVPSVPSAKVYNPNTKVGPIDLAHLLNNPNTPANPNNNGDFLFIDTWGVKSGTTWLPPPTTGADIDAAALLNTLPVFDIAGNPFYTTGIVYVAGSVTFGGLGQPRTLRVETPPGKDLHYLHNSPALFTPTDDNIPIRPDPAEPRDQFDIQVHINGAIYLDGDFRGAGNPVVYGALTSERGYSGAGTPEVWYNYTLNETGIQNALCVECCSIAARPAILDLLPGNTQTLAITNGSGQLLFRSSNPSVATVDQSGLVTAVGSGFAIVWAVDSNNCTVAVPVRTATQCVGLKIIPEMVPDPNTAGATFDIVNGVGPVEILTIQDPNDPTGGYPIAHWEWSADKNPAGQDVVTVAPQGVANPQPSVGNNYTAIITGQRCGQTTVRAKDLTGVCTSIYETVVTVGSALDITGINPDKSDYRVGETVTLTASGGTGTVLWHTLPSANVSLSTNAGPTTQMTFKVPGIVQVDVSDDLNCVSEIHDFYAKCSQVTGTTTSPVAGSLRRVDLREAHHGLERGPQRRLRHEPNRPDRLRGVLRHARSGHRDRLGLHLHRHHRALLRLRRRRAGGCKAGDVSTWMTGWYTLRARVVTTAYSCGAQEAWVQGSVFVNNCKMQFSDDLTPFHPCPSGSPPAWATAATSP